MRNIRKQENNKAHLPAIALTAFDRKVDRLTALEAGFDIHVSKPFEPHLLLSKIHGLLNSVH